jgi:hypothetical protein
LPLGKALGSLLKMTDDLISKISNREISELDFIKLAEKNDEGIDKFFNRFYI